MFPLNIIIIPVFYSLIFSLLSGPIGCLILWKRMTFFGETIAHASLMGYVLQYLLGIPIELSMMMVSVVYCFLLEFINDKGLDQSSFLPLLSYGLMGLSLILFDKIIKNSNLIYSILVGDILLVTWKDCQILLLMAVATISLIFYFYNPLILSLFSKELGSLHYKKIKYINLLMNILIAITITFAVQTVGILLAMAMLTIPSLTAFYCSHNAKQMILRSIILSASFALVGFLLSIIFDAAVGPTISLIALIGHIFIRGFKFLKTTRRLRP